MEKINTDLYPPQNFKTNGVVAPISDYAKLNAALEERISSLEATIQLLLEKEKARASTSDKRKVEAVSKPEPIILTDEELCLPTNWIHRFQWRRKTIGRDGEEYSVIGSPGQITDIDIKTISLIHDEDLKGSPKRIIIKNPIIQSKFRRIPGIETFDEFRLNLNSVEVHEPFSPLFHYIEEVREGFDADETVTPFDKADMHALEMFCSEGVVGSMFQNIQRLIEQSLITAEQQWALFRPGISVVTKVLGEPEILKVKSIGIKDSHSYRDRDWNKDRYLTCSQIAWSGKCFGEREKEILLPKFPGSRKLVELEVCPLEKFPTDERNKIEDKATKRGQIWKKFYDVGHAIPKECDTLCLPLLSESEGYWDPFTGEQKRDKPAELRIFGRVIIDPEASAKASKLGTMTETYTLSTFEIEPFTESSFQTEDILSQYMRCSALIEVFSLTDGLWYRVPVLELIEPDWMEDPWNQLELSGDNKELLINLVNAHRLPDKRSGDLIRKKGNGLIFLFHGQPGLGKTLTAEALSESIKRPLYRVNLGLIAAKQDWEPALEQIFRDANSWQAVLLLDEAEVIMEARTKDRMQQNSWCSVFLRKLEYYEGILILTTNLIHTIDKAFRSRINIAIHYDEFTLEQKTSLWQLFIGRLHPERSDVSGLKRKVEMWARQGLNGRQIRNIVLTAEALALGQSEYCKMDARHIEQIIRNTEDFNRAIENEKRGKSALKVGSIPQNW